MSNHNSVLSIVSCIACCTVLPDKYISVSETGFVPKNNQDHIIVYYS